MEIVAYFLNIMYMVLSPHLAVIFIPHTESALGIMEE